MRVIFVLIAVSMALQGTMFESQLGQLQKSRLGRTIIRLAEISDSNTLFDAIDELVSSFKERKLEESESFDRALQAWISDDAFYGEQVSQYTAEVAQHQVDLDTIKQSRLRLQQSLYSTTAELQTAQQTLAAIQKEISNTENSTTKKVQEYQNAISIIDQVIAKMSLVKGESFITLEDLQIDTATLNRRLASMSDRVFAYEPITHILSQISSGKFSDQQQVQNVIKLLNQLRQDLVASNASIQNQSQVQIAENHELAEIYQTKIDNLNEVIPQLQGDIETYTGQLEAKQSLLADAQDNLAKSQANLDAVNASWEDRQAQNGALNQTYDNELLILSQAVAALERGGIRR